MAKVIEHNGTTIVQREGNEARERMNDLIMNLTDTDNMEDAHVALVGRPPIMSDLEASTIIQFRIPKSWKDKIAEDAKKEGESTVSEYLRSLLIRRHKELQSA